MLNLPLQPQQVFGPLLIVIISLSLYLFEPGTSEWLAYDRTLVKSHEIWRLISANFLHTNLNHLLLNAAGLLLLWSLHGDYYKIDIYLNIFIICCLGCTLGIYFFAEKLVWYVGLSGALHGLFVWGAYKDIQAGLRSGWLLFLGVWAKIAYEQIIGPSADVASLIEANVATEAHLFGAITGLVVVLVCMLYHKMTQPKVV